MKAGLNTETLNIILDIPKNIEINKIHLVINGIKYLLVNQEKEIDNVHASISNNKTIDNIAFNTRNNYLLNAIEKLPSGKYKNGDGRKIQMITNQYKIGLSSGYQAQKLLKDAPTDILLKVRRGEMQIKTAYKIVKEYEKKLEKNHSKIKRKKINK